MAVFLLNHCWATGPPWSPHSECKALISIGIVIPRVFFQSLGFQPFCLSEVPNCILLPWVPSSVAARKAFFVCSCPLLLLDVEPSELVLNPKTSYVSATQGIWLTCHLILFRLSLTVSFTAISPVQALICIALWKRCFLDVLIWFWIFQVTHMAFQCEANDILLCDAGDAQNQHTLPRQNCI